MKIVKISMPSFEVPQQMMESSIEDETPRLYNDDNVLVVPTYQVIEDGQEKKSWRAARAILTQ